MIVFKIDPPNTGRLGNQLFQIAATASHANDVKDKAQFTTWEYNKYMLNPINDDLNTQFDYIFEGIQHEPEFSLQFEYKPLPSKKNIVLHGFFQSEKYFLHNKDLIINTFKPKNEFLRVVRDAGAEFLNLQNTVAVHVRRGDYFQKKDCHPVLSETDYYGKALIEMRYGKKFDNFVFFSDDIEWVKQNLIGSNDSNNYFVRGNSDIVDLFLMAQCQNHIIANSSFSWWASWLSKNMFHTKGITIAPKQWFGPALKYDTKDLYLKDWVKM